MLQPPNKKLIFVQPLLNGSPANSAELALASARRLSAAGAKVELWATTAGMGSDGIVDLNRHPTGELTQENMLIRRFPSHARNASIHEDLSQRLLRGDHLSDEEEGDFFVNDLWSEKMRDAIFEWRHESIYIFQPCVAATTVYGVAAAPLQSVMAPDLTHPFLARLGMVRQTIALCHHFLFSSEPEQWLAKEIFNLDAKRCLAAAGIDGADEPSAAATEGSSLVAPPYLVADASDPIYLPRLCEMVGRLIADTPLSWKLVLLHGHPRQIPARYEGVVHVIEDPKPNLRASLLSNATCYVHFSEQERVPALMLEAWLRHCPALVYSASAVAKAHVHLSQGGLYFDSYEEFRHALVGLARQPKLSRTLGESGHQYVRRRFRWSLALERQIRFLREIEQWLNEVKV